MTQSTSTMAVQDEIRRDLRRLRRDRAITLAGYLALLAIFLLWLFLTPAHEHALDRSATWYVSLLLMFGASVSGAALTVGVPLASRATLLGARRIVLAALVAALLLAMDVGQAPPDNPWVAGADCFVYCTVISGAAMVVLGFLSGRLWRRFPDPGWVLAIGLTGVGLSALHMQCGGADPVHLFVFHLGPVVVLYAMARGLISLREYVLRDD